MENSATQPEDDHESHPVQAPSPQTIFLNLESGTPSEEIESLCMNCEKNGKTRFLFTKIPFFKEIIVSSFECEECGFKNNEVQFGGKLSDFGVKYVLKVVNAINMNRNVVKSEYATIKIPELELEIPPITQKGSVNTVEGFLMKTIEGIQENQEERRKYDPATAAKLDDYIQKIQEFIEGKRFPFTLIVEDPSGNSFVQNPNAPNKDVYMVREEFVRSYDDYSTMGFSTEQTQEQLIQDENLKSAIEERKIKSKNAPKSQTKEEQEAFLQKMKVYGVRDAEPEIQTAANIDFGRSLDDQVKSEEEKNGEENVNKEVMHFPTFCYSCGLEGEAKMCTSSIPYFKEIIIMAFSCDQCGYRNTEIKNGGGISDKATRIVINVKKPADLNRDVFKSDSCIVAIPEVDFAMAPGSLGSHYTTIEGLLDLIITNLTDNNPFGTGDSALNKKYQEFIKKVEKLKEGNTEFSLVLDDALSNCFVYNPFAPEADPQMEITVYERTWDQNEELGINDMNV